MNVNSSKRCTSGCSGPFLRYLDERRRTVDRIENPKLLDWNPLERDLIEKPIRTILPLSKSVNNNTILSVQRDGKPWVEESYGGKETVSNRDQIVRAVEPCETIDYAELE